MNPVTKPNLEVIRRHEAAAKEKLDELMQVALDNDELIIVKAEP